MSTTLPAVPVIKPVLNEERHLRDAYEAQRARDLLDEGAPLMGTVHGRPKPLLPLRGEK
ncbi:hypothetical protein AB0D30_31335 [Streptomyces sp. NPDC048409]|uniref:hypothetical protein n=1 Tax=Streptomyces sp. NPDC048409 TaxID=3154723 RepID=UPI0034289F7D